MEIINKIFEMNCIMDNNFNLILKLLRPKNNNYIEDISLILTLPRKISDDKYKILIEKYLSMDYLYLVEVYKFLREYGDDILLEKYMSKFNNTDENEIVKKTETDDRRKMKKRKKDKIRAEKRKWKKINMKENTEKVNKIREEKIEYENKMRKIYRELNWKYK
ncbi:hypothetical protein SLOPH_877 [Spraguea lophii 42_110]|uniref:Uncharacterized protein n=1 Tax=Spraguea lophii (strain 42_110) TaxID=1358809 RepID=S7W8E8_SPRLO|nr:hypothetical protein SLOPH_877 [Spraguea lophii 42_110]